MLSESSATPIRDEWFLLAPGQCFRAILPLRKPGVIGKCNRTKFRRETIAVARAATGSLARLIVQAMERCNEILRATSSVWGSSLSCSSLSLSTRFDSAMNLRALAKVDPRLHNWQPNQTWTRYTPTWRRFKPIWEQTSPYPSKPCGLSPKEIFGLIQSMDLFEPCTAAVDCRLVPSRLKEFKPRQVDRGAITWVDFIGHTVPTPAAVAYLAQLIGDTPSISIGAGCALWEYLIAMSWWSSATTGPATRGRRTGTTTVATNEAGVMRVMHAIDRDPPAWSYMPVQRMCAEDERVNWEAYENLLLLWPPPSDEDPDAFDMVAVRKFRGRRLVFIGEHHAHNVGSSLFWKHVVCSASEWRLLSKYALPHCVARRYTPWLYIFERNWKLSARTLD